ncbi:putative phospholipase A(1) [Helianthus annuus]|nr:putative phospholipase A(1) [Helianthus annuus]
MACLDHEWEHVPLLQIWKQIQDGNGNSTPILETFTPIEAVSIFTQALSTNELSYGGVDIPLPFNKEILQWANKPREILSSAKLPSSVKFYNVYGTGLDTPQSVWADGLDAEARVGILGEHRGILCDKHLFRIVKHWLKADHDPFYNPVNDYVILPTLFEIERHHDNKGKEVTSLKEEWEIVSEDESEAMVGSISASCVGDVLSSSLEAHATFIVHPQSNGKQHITQCCECYFWCLN